MTDMNVAVPAENDAPAPRVLVVEDDPDQRELICEAIAHVLRGPPEGCGSSASPPGRSACQQDLATSTWSCWTTTCRT